MSEASSVYDFSAEAIGGGLKSLADYRGQVIVIVNTASECGLTKQYADLERLYRQYKDQGLVILGFPCNQFGKQEPGDEQQIAQFCQLHYEVTFPMFRKIKVNGPEAHPLYVYLRNEARGVLIDEIKWNFTKFVIDRGGNVVKRYAPTTTPAEMESDLQQLLEQQ